MKSSSTTVTRLLFVTALAAAGAVHAQSVQTPFSPPETGIALTPAEEAASFGAGGVPCVTPYSPNECGPADMGRGGTLEPELGGSIEVRGRSLDRLPATPEPHWDVNTIDD